MSNHSNNGSTIQHDVIYIPEGNFLSEEMYQVSELHAGINKNCGIPPKEAHFILHPVEIISDNPSSVQTTTLSSGSFQSEGNHAVLFSHGSSLCPSYSEIPSTSSVIPSLIELPVEILNPKSSISCSSNPSSVIHKRIDNNKEAKLSLKYNVQNDHNEAFKFSCSNDAESSNAFVVGSLNFHAYLPSDINDSSYLLESNGKNTLIDATKTVDPPSNRLLPNISSSLDKIDSGHLLADPVLPCGFFSERGNPYLIKNEHDNQSAKYVGNKYSFDKENFVKSEETFLGEDDGYFLYGDSSISEPLAQECLQDFSSFVNISSDNSSLPKYTFGTSSHSIIQNFNLLAELSLSNPPQTLENPNISLDLASVSSTDDVTKHSNKNEAFESNFSSALKINKNSENKPKNSLNRDISIDTESSVNSLGVIEDCMFQEVSLYKCPFCSYLAQDKKQMTEHAASHKKTESSRTSQSDIVKDSLPKASNNQIASTHEDKEPAVSQTISMSPVTSVVLSATNTTTPNDQSDTNTSIDKKPKKMFPKSKMIGIVRIKCKVDGCCLRFETQENLTYHKKCHLGAKLVCPECTSIFPNWRQMAEHLWKAHSKDVGLYKCEKCNYKCYSYNRLIRMHSKTHTDERPFSCKECGKLFKTRKNLEAHKIQHKPRDEILTLACALCNRKFCEKRMLEKHLNSVHLKIKPFLCNYCGKSFASKSTLNLHMRLHTGEKPFECQVCSYRTSDHNSYRRHKMQHTQDKRYKCKYCDYSSIQSTTFKCHMMDCHKEDAEKDGILFLCKHCKFNTVGRGNYLTHISLHHKESESNTEKENKEI